MALWSVRSSTDRAVWVRALAGDIELCSWARHFTLTMPLSTSEYKWVTVICWGNPTNRWGVTCDGLTSRPGGVEILPAASCYGNRDKLRPDEPVGSKASLSALPHLFFSPSGSKKLYFFLQLPKLEKSSTPYLATQENLTYLIGCKKCHLQYIGETMRQLN